ncbi:Uncharacterised protein [Candidatus Norongarragalina meridionalis]|nr:Uncharacterised protein [Candidatus Norongarragalina meridionalis]
MKKRGQAFETMMLVISVIVAVAILGVLLGFISRIGPGIGGDALTTMQTQLKSVQSRGFGSSNVEKATFKEGSIRVGELVVDLPVSANDVKFSAVDGGICGSSDTDPLKCEEKKITINKQIVGYITTCKGESGPYVIVIGSENQKTEVTTKCDECVDSNGSC